LEETSALYVQRKLPGKERKGTSGVPRFSCGKRDEDPGDFPFLRGEKHRPPSEKNVIELRESGRGEGRERVHQIVSSLTRKGLKKKKKKAGGIRVGRETKRGSFQPPETR